MSSAVQAEKFSLNISDVPGLERKFVNTDYFANVCHEIRSPLGAIVGLASILAGQDIGPKKRQECAIMLQDSSHMLTELLNDLLDSFKIDNGRMDIEHIVFDLTKVLEEAKNIITVKAKEKGLGIDMQIGKGLPALYVGDPLRIRQILLNLLGNAVKFTSQGIISLHMTEEKIFNGHFEINITVADCGIGIDNEKLGKIFDKYTQGDPSISREYGGTGLGLFISQELAHLMKGSITVKSWPHIGSHFTLTLPLQKAPVLVATT
jgi:signal transduction histidine kinase